jgi:hypothetical protein
MPVDCEGEGKDPDERQYGDDLHDQVCTHVRATAGNTPRSPEKGFR